MAFSADGTHQIGPNDPLVEGSTTSGFDITPSDTTVSDVLVYTEDNLQIAFNRIKRLNITGTSSLENTTRPTDWYSLPRLTKDDRKFAGLIGVTNNSSNNHVAITATGNFTIDWGDGSIIENIASGVIAEHQYTYSSLSDLSISTLGYKQAIVLITPQDGQELKNIDLQKRHSSLSVVSNVYWLDIISAFSTTTGSGITCVIPTNVVEFPWLARISLLNGTFTTTSYAALNISNVAVTNVTQTSLSIGWSLDRAATGQVEYGLTGSYGTTSTLVSDYLGNHNIFIMGLTANTQYYYRVKSVSIDGVTSYSDQALFTTLADVTLNISNVTVSGRNTTSAYIGWTTDLPAGSRVQYGTAPSYGSFTTIDNTLVLSHSQQITGLSANTLYYFRCISLTAGDALTAYSAQSTFTTDAAATLVISNIVVSAITTEQATIAWDLSTAGNAQIEYGLTNSYGSTTTLETNYLTSRTQNITGLTPNTLYYYRIHSVTAGAVSAYSAENTFTTAQQVLVASNITVSGIATTTATVGWSLNIAANGQVEYGTTTALGSTTTLEASYLLSHTQTITGLSASTTYYYRVHSVTAGGLVLYSAIDTFSTTAPAALIISNITTSGITADTAYIGWSLSEPGNGQVQYGLTNAYGSLSTLATAYLSAHNQRLTPLAAGTTYNYRIHSITAAGLEAYSANGTFITTGDAAFINVKTAYGAQGNGSTDDTAAFNSAISECPSGGTVYVPNGTYMIESVSTGITMLSGRRLLLETGAILKCITNSSGHYQIIKFPTTCTGATIEGSGTRQSTIQGDRITHTDPGNIPVGQNEQGLGVVCQGINNTVKNVIVRDCWGDGIYIYGNTNGVIIDNVDCNNNRRQGLSVTNGTNIIIRNSLFRETIGTAPQCGIDVEPNTGNSVSYIQIINSTFTHNANAGISLNCNTGPIDNAIVTGNIFIQFVNYCINQAPTSTNVTVNNNRLNSSTGTLLTKHGQLWY